MAELQSFDKLNVLSYDTYFGEMGLPKQQTDDRKRLADHIEDAMLFLFALMMFTKDIDYIKTAFYAEIINGIEDADTYVTELVSEMSDKIVDTTFKHRNDSDTGRAKNNTTELSDENQTDITVSPTDRAKATNGAKKKGNYFFSTERAKRVAADLANTIRNHVDYVGAVVTGKKTKTWNTILDGKERESHFDANGQTIPIDEAFVVGGSLLMFPKDRSLGASDDEIVNCRCTCTYK